MGEQVSITDWASIYLADEIPVAEFCEVFERWWHADRGGLSEAGLAAAKVLVDAIAWYSKGNGACIPAGKARDEASVRSAVVDFLEAVLQDRDAPAAGQVRGPG